MNNEIDHLSFSSMHKLSDEPKKFYEQYVKHNRDNFWSDAMVIGGAVHSWIEQYNIGEIDSIDTKPIKAFLYKFVDKKREEYISRLDEGEQPDEYNKHTLVRQGYKAVRNFLELDLGKPLNNEYAIYTPLCDIDIKYKGFIDAVYKDHILDYKIVKNFGDLDEWYAGRNKSKYWWQGLFYCVGYSLQEDTVINTAKFLEIKKAAPTKTAAVRMITFHYSEEDFELAIEEFKRSCNIAKNMTKDVLLTKFDNADSSIKYEVEELL